MSIDDNLRTLGNLLSKEQIRAIKSAARQRGRELKFQRKTLDNLARAILIRHYILNGRKWDTKANNAQFRRLMANRHKIHSKLFRLIGEKRDPEFDSP